MLDFAVLGLLYEAPMHGYELRKQLGTRLGGFRAFSYGSLYPALRRLVRDGLITEDEPEPEPGDVWTRRSRRRVYHLTAEGKERFVEMLADAGPRTWEDDGFGIHLTFFSRTPAETRMRILEGRRRRVEERREARRSALGRAGEQIDRYTRELHRQGLDASEREVRWLNELIAHERAEQHRTRAGPDQDSATTATTATPPDPLSPPDTEHEDNP
ncbi:MAG: helix-turn-helix transcriptional regulator [Pseudonocardiales bacterium]|nr:helix-turn-helix transcriptional regulator [Pseudonocardiales bacterium]